VKQRPPWDERIERAELLRETHEAAAQLLGFYAGVLRLQKSIYEELISTGQAAIASLAVHAPALLRLVEESAPEAMAQLARGLRHADWSALLTAQWNAQLNQLERKRDFFAEALLQPYAESLARDTPSSDGTLCPFCNAPPQLAAMRPEGEGARRFLCCGMCSTEWGYRRLKCVPCGEEDKERLPNFRGDRYPHIYLAACESCLSFLKCIDLSVDGHAVPAVDDIASVSLSLWAIEQGYHPVNPNLFGF
jgi:FdhE protein